MPPAELGALLAPALSAGLFGGGPVPSDRFLALATENCQDKIEVLTEAAPLLARVLGYPLAETLAGGEADEILAGNFKVRPTAPQAHPFFCTGLSCAGRARPSLPLGSPLPLLGMCLCPQAVAHAVVAAHEAGDLPTGAEPDFDDRWKVAPPGSLTLSLSLSRAPCPT